MKEDYVKIVVCEDIPIYCRENPPENVPIKTFLIPVDRIDKGWVASLDSKELIWKNGFLKYKPANMSAQVKRLLNLTEQNRQLQAGSSSKVTGKR